MFCNPTRKHTNNGMLSPVACEIKQQNTNVAGISETRGTSDERCCGRTGGCPDFLEPLWWLARNRADCTTQQWLFGSSGVRSGGSLQAVPAMRMATSCFLYARKVKQMVEQRYLDPLDPYSGHSPKLRSEIRFLNWISPKKLNVFGIIWQSAKRRKATRRWPLS